MRTDMNTETKPQPDFEAALSELETLVARLESGELNLDQSLDHFKRGVELTRACQAILNDAQQTIDRLNEQDTPPVQDVVESSS